MLVPIYTVEKLHRLDPAIDRVMQALRRGLEFELPPPQTLRSRLEALDDLKPAGGWTANSLSALKAILEMTANAVGEQAELLIEKEARRGI